MAAQLAPIALISFSAGTMSSDAQSRHPRCVESVTPLTGASRGSAVTEWAITISVEAKSETPLVKTISASKCRY
jgi:hypothetical protein